MPRAGFNKLDTSRLPPDADPAPIMVWISSINNIGLFWSSKNFSTDLSRFSKSPLYLVPAIKAPISKEYNFDSCKNSGVSLELIRCANPSAIAVLPTPD